MNKRFANWALAGIGSFALACAEHPVTLPDQTGTAKVPSFGVGTPFNNAGQCLGNDAVTWEEFVDGEGPESADDLTCTSNDVAVTNVVAREILVNGVWVPVGPGSSLTCTAGEPVSLRLTATLTQASLETRYDVGLWVATDGGTAQTGSCNHYNLPVNPLPDGATNGDIDSCGNTSANTDIDIDLGELTLPCETGNSGFLELPTCLAWSALEDQGACPETTVSGADGFRAGTLPFIRNKCNCEPVVIGVPATQGGSITIIKDAVPNDAQDFSFTTTGTGLSSFSLDDDADPALPAQRTFTGLADGIYTIAEAAVPGFDLTALTCTTGGSGNAATLTATVTISAGGSVTCTFVNTKRATVQLNKRENGALPLTRPWGFQLRVSASTSSAGNVIATGSADVTTGVVNFSCSPNPNPLCANVGGVANLLPVNYQLCEINIPAAYSNNIASPPGFTPAGAVAEGGENATECVDITLAASASGVPAGVPDPIDNVAAVSGGSITLQTGSFTLLGGDPADALSGSFSIRNSSGGTQQVLVTGLAIVDATFRDGPNLIHPDVTGCVFAPVPKVIAAGGSEGFTLSGCLVTPSVRKELTFTIRATISGGDQPFYDRTYKVRKQ